MCDHANFAIELLHLFYSVSDKQEEMLKRFYLAMLHVHHVSIHRVGLLW